MQNEGTASTHDPIHILLAIHDPSGTYSQHAGVVMTSIFENTTSKVTIHILHDDTLTPNNRAKFIRTAEKYSQVLDLIDVTNQLHRIDSKTADFLANRWTVGCMYRLLAPELLDLPKIIYLDCDIVVNLDIKEMWDIDIQDYCLAGMHSKASEGASNALRNWLNGSSSKTYINSGVLIMNLEEIRKTGNLFDRSIAYHIRRRHMIHLSDQDILNALFYGHIKLIDSKYNNCNPTAWEQTTNSIIHTPTTVHGFKTWGMLGLPSQHLYWKYYTRSAWGENMTNEELAELMLCSAEKSSSSFNHGAFQYIVEVSKRIMSRIFYRSEAACIIRYLAKEAAYRVRHIFSRS